MIKKKANKSTWAHDVLETQTNMRWKTKDQTETQESNSQVLPGPQLVRAVSHLAVSSSTIYVRHYGNE